MVHHLPLALRHLEALTVEIYRVCGVPEVVDLDGDGTMELIGSDCNGMAQIFFKRDGKLHEANIGSLLASISLP